MAWVGSVQPMFISIGQTGIFVQWKAPLNCFHGPFFENISLSCLTTQFIYFHIKDFALKVIQYGNTLFIWIQSRHHFEENQLLPHGRPNNSKRFSSWDETQMPRKISADKQIFLWNTLNETYMPVIQGCNFSSRPIIFLLKNPSCLFKQVAR